MKERSKTIDPSIINLCRRKPFLDPLCLQGCQGCLIFGYFQFVFTAIYALGRKTSNITVGVLFRPVLAFLPAENISVGVWAIVAGTFESGGPRLLYQHYHSPDDNHNSKGFNGNPSRTNSKLQLVF